MKHFLAAFKRLFPVLAPLVEASERDMAEEETEFQRKQVQDQLTHAHLREQAQVRRRALRANRRPE